MEDSTLAFIPAAMRPKAAAAYCGFTENRFAKMRIEKTGPRFGRAGRSIYYLREELDRWLREQQIAA